MEMCISDICELETIENIHILKCLESRYSNNCIYTNASNVLISINPYKHVQIYGRNSMRIHGEKYSEPHIYATASSAENSLKKDGINQSIVISGLTGSGKTESVKHILDFLCQSDSSLIAENILATNPILESFGNAKTEGNLNSSRFCKFIKLLYNEEKELIAACCQYNMLELNRINGTEDSNFHIFYMLLKSEMDMVKDLNITEFKYLPKNQNQVPYDMNNIENALTLFGIKEEKKTLIYRVLIGILILGNIEFDTYGNENDSCELSNKSKPILQKVAEPFKIKHTMLGNVFISRSIFVQNTEIRIPLDIQAAIQAKDSFARILYEHLFRQIIAHINFKMAPPTPTSTSCIGIVDIAGFESKSRGVNKFDQLCINYYNERMQNLFVELILTKEKKWYERENLEVPFVHYFDNSGIIDLFDNESNGLFAVLDQECILKKPSIEAFKRKILAKGNLISPSSVIDEFSVQHFAGQVIYSTTNFISKNMFSSSSNMFEIIQEILKPIMMDTQTPKTFKTVNIKMRYELNQLINYLKNTNIHFVRCIKPNKNQIPNEFDSTFVLQQLNSFCLISYVQFMRFGYPIHISMKALNEIFTPFGDEFGKVFHDKKKFYKLFAISMGLTLEDFKLGSNMVFFRKQNSNFLDQLLNSETNSIKLIVNKMKLKRKIAAKWQMLAKHVLLRKRHQNIMSERQVTEEKPKANDIVCNDQECNVISKALTAPAEEKVKDKGDKRDINSCASKPKRARYEKKPENSIRYDNTKHLAVADDNPSATRCKNENCSYKSNIFCSRCKVHLCVKSGRNCFKKFHTLNNEDEC